MKKFLLSAFVCFSSYAGVYASSDRSINNSKENSYIEILNGVEDLQISQPSEVQQNNCFATVQFIDNDGEPVTIQYETRTDSPEECLAMINNWVNIFLAAGWEVVNLDWNWVP